MNFGRKCIAAAVLVCMVGAAVAGSKMEMTGESSGLTGLSLFDRKETIYFGYEDESLTDYITSAAVAFGEAENVRVIPKLLKDSEYLEAVNEATLHSAQLPDAYLLSDDSLEKAYLAGLADKVKDPEGILNEEHFPKAALSAVTYREKQVGYPFSFETSALVYNESYLVEWARQQAEKELTGAGNAGDDSEEEPVEADTESVQVDETALAEKTKEYLAVAIPGTVDDILNIGDSFDVPEGVEGILKWDVSDIFYNYWIVGNYMIVGGDCGDDESNISINNPETISCLEVYKALNQFFFIESDTVTYDSVVEDFINGKTVFTIATTDVVKKLEEARTEGRMSFEYGIACMPMVSDTLKSRSLSVTNAVVINGYSEEKELAERFAAFLTNSYCNSLYERTGKVSANLLADTGNGALAMFKEEYAKSIPMPKMMETNNLWIQLEILFSRVWNGADASQLVGELAEQIQSQIGE